MKKNYDFSTWEGTGEMYGATIYSSTINIATI